MSTSTVHLDDPAIHPIAGITRTLKKPAPIIGIMTTWARSQRTSPQVIPFTTGCCDSLSYFFTTLPPKPASSRALSMVFSSYRAASAVTMACFVLKFT